MEHNKKEETKKLSAEELKELKKKKEQEKNKLLKKSYDNLFAVLSSTVESGLAYNNKRIALIISCSEICLNNLNEFKIERNQKTNHIEEKSLRKWIEKLYNKALKTKFNDLVYSDFRVQNRVYFDALKDIALSVQFMIGNFKGGTNSLDKIPFCKVMLNEKNIVDVEKGKDILVNFNSDNWNNEKAIFQFEEINYKIFIRASSINLCDKTLVKDNLKIDSKDLPSNQIVYDLSITELKEFAKTVINFSVPNDDVTGDTWQKKIVADVDALTSQFVDFRRLDTDKDKTNATKGLESFFQGNAKDNIHNCIIDFIKTSVAKKHFKEVFELVNSIHLTFIELSKTNSEFKTYLNDNKEIFVYQKGLDENAKGQLVKYGISLVA